MNTLYTAICWVAQGISVIPAFHRDKRPMVRWQEYQTRLPELHELTKWFGPAPVNLAVICGWKGLTVIDFDNRDSYTLWRQWDQQGHQNTYTVNTARGTHAYFFLDQAPKCKPLGFLDIKGAGGYVLAPPSIHPSGTPYQAINNLPIKRVPSIQDLLPAAWLEEPTLPEPQPHARPPQDIWDIANNAKGPIVKTIEEIKRSIRIETMFDELFPSTNGYYLALCPLHDDHNPSMWVDIRRQRCGCYAGCTTKALDVIELYAKTYRITEYEAMRELAQRI